MDFRIIATLAALAVPHSAFALCSGEGLDTHLSPETLAEVNTVAQTVPYGHGLAWAAEKDGMSVHLYGSMHIYDPRLEPLRVEVIADLLDAELLLVEQTLDEQFDMQQALTSDPSHLLLPDNQSLIELVSAQTWDTLSAAANARGIPPSIVTRFQPWYIIVMLATPPCAMVDLQSGLAGLDVMVLEEVAQMPLPTRSLEDWEDTIGLLSGGTIDEQLALLETSLLPAELEQAMFVSTVETYFAEDTARLWALSRAAITLMENVDQAEALATFDEFEKELLADRNHAWIPVIEEAAETADTVALFGAAHLPGEDGVLNLLAQNGWTITPLE